MRNGFCFLTDNLPRKIVHNGKAMVLNTSTASAIAVLLYLNNPKATAYSKGEYIVARLLVNPDSKPYTLKQVLDCFGCSEEKLASYLFKYLDGYTKPVADGQKTANNASLKKTGKLPCFDFIQDSDAIISAMRQNYGLSVTELQNMHWWEFLALFNNLPDNSFFSTIKQIRTMKIDPKDSPERKQQIKEAKRTFAIVDTRTKEQKKADVQLQFDALEL